MVIAPASDIDTNAVDPLGIPLHHDPKLAPRRRDATARFKLLTDQQQGTYLRREMPIGLRRAPDIDWARVPGKTAVPRDRVAEAARLQHPGVWRPGRHGCVDPDAGRT